MDFGLSISVLLLIISMIYYLFKPKKVNRFYGYRTFKSMKNIDNWKFSNNTFSIGMLIISGGNSISLFLSSLVFSLEKISVYYFVALLIIQFAFLIYWIEKKLTKNGKK